METIARLRPTTGVDSSCKDSCRIWAHHSCLLSTKYQHYRETLATMESPAKSFTVRHATFDDVLSLATIVPRSFHPTNPYILKVSLSRTLGSLPVSQTLLDCRLICSTKLFPNVRPAPPQHPRHPPMVDQNLHLQAPIPNNIAPPHSSLLC